MGPELYINPIRIYKAQKFRIRKPEEVFLVFSQIWVNDHHRITTTCLQRPQFWGPNFNFHNTKLPLHNDHLSKMATNFWSQGWLLYTSLTVLIKIYLMFPCYLLGYVPLMPNLWIKALRNWEISIHTLLKWLWELTKLTKLLIAIIIASFVIAKINETKRLNNNYNHQFHLSLLLTKLTIKTC